MTTLERLQSLTARILDISPDLLRPNAHLMDELGADSLQFLEYVASVEKEFGIPLKGSDSEKLSTLQKSANFVDNQNVAAAPTEAPEIDEVLPDLAQLHAEDIDRYQQGNTGMWLDDSGNLHCPVEIGMPMTGRNNLGETPLLKLIGDLRWKHVEMFSGVPSKDLCDDTDERLYATFFYVEINFNDSDPMASIGENDRLHIVSSLRSSGGSVLDGHHWLIKDPSEAIALSENSSLTGVPYVRTSNIFVKMLQGAQWLKKSKPCQDGLKAVPSMDAPPSTAETCRLANENNRFEEAPQGWLSLSDEPVETFYDIVPDRDLNGAGLLYFANYPQILDICEREILANLLPVKFEQSILDHRTTVRRQVAYLSNASQSDRIRVTAEVAVEDPFAASENSDKSPEDQEIFVWINFVMNRCSDDRKMLVCTVRKKFTDVTWGDTTALESLRARR